MPLIAPEDRHAIDDLYAEYVWALDTGDVPAFLALFTPDGVFGDTAGKIYKGQDAIGAYVRALTGHDARRWEPKRLRLRLFSVAGRIARHARRVHLRLARHAPCAELILTACQRLSNLPQLA